MRGLSPDANLAEIIAEWAAWYEWDERDAFLCGHDVYTHGEAHRGGAKMAGLLRSHGVRPGDRVLIALPDSIEFVWAFLGTVRLGAIAVLVDPDLTAEEHAYILGDASPSATVCVPEVAPRFPRVLTLADLTEGLPGAVPAEAHPVEPDAPAYVQYTYSRNGRPKGAVHRHRDPEVHYTAIGVDALGLRENDVLLSACKIHSSYGLGNTTFFPLFSGAAAVLRPDPPTIASMVERARSHRPSLLFARPSFYLRLLQEGDRDAFAPLRAAAAAGGTQLSAAEVTRVEDWLRHPLLAHLGSTEVGHGFISNTFSRRRSGTVGTAMEPYEISVRGSSGQPEERGMLHVRGPSVMVEYLGRPKDTAEVLEADGWLRTGDVVSVDEDGFVRHLGRADDARDPCDGPRRESR